MTDEEAVRAIVANWLGKSDQALAAARREHAADDLEFAVNRVYYACFYALTATLLRDGLEFSSHAAVRSALHHFLVKPGRLPAELGSFYDRAFEDRQEADYTVVSSFDAFTVDSRITQATRFTEALKKIALRP